MELFVPSLPTSRQLEGPLPGHAPTTPEFQESQSMTTVSQLLKEFYPR